MTRTTLSLALVGFATACGGDDGGGASTGDGSTGTPTTMTTMSSTSGVADSSGSTAVDDSSTGDPMTGSTGSSSSSGTTAAGECRVIIAEVLYDIDGADDFLQWVKLHNTCNEDIDLATYSLGYGGLDYTSGTEEIDGNVTTIIPAGGCYLIGGDVTNASNGMPVFDYSDDFAPSLLLAAVDGPGAAMALFDVTFDQIEVDTVPVDAVVYGSNNDNGFIDETGAVVAVPHVPGVALDSGDSIRRVDPAGLWEIADPPTPNDCPTF